MRIVIDRELCEANERCMEIVPQVFHVNDDGVLQLLMEDAPEELQEQVTKAAKLCPRGAITLVTDGD